MKKEQVIEWAESEARLSKERFLSESAHAASDLRQLADEIDRCEMHTFSVENIGIVLSRLEQARLENEVRQEDLKVLKELAGGE